MNAGSCVWLCLRSLYYVNWLFGYSFRYKVYYCAAIHTHIIYYTSGNACVAVKAYENQYTFTHRSLCSLYHSLVLSPSYIYMCYTHAYIHIPETIRYRWLFPDCSIALETVAHSETIHTRVGLDGSCMCVCVFVVNVHVFVWIDCFVLCLSVQLESEQCTWAKQRWMNSRIPFCSYAA